MHLFTSTVTGLVAISYFTNLALASPVAIDRRDAAVEESTAELVARDGSSTANSPRHCCTSGCGYCKNTPGCLKLCAQTLYFDTCCTHGMMKTSVMVDSVDEIPWAHLGGDFLGEEFDTPREPIVKRAPTPSPEEAAVPTTFEDPYKLSHCCLMDCRVCMVGRCPKDSTCESRDKSVFSQCCKGNKDAIFLDVSFSNVFDSEAAVYKHLAAIGHSIPDVAKRDPPTSSVVTEPLSTPTEDPKPSDNCPSRDDDPEAYEPGDGYCTPGHHPWDGLDHTERDTNGGQQVGVCCNEDCTFCDFSYYSCSDDRHCLFVRPFGFAKCCKTIPG